MLPFKFVNFNGIINSLDSLEDTDDISPQNQTKMEIDGLIQTPNSQNAGAKG